MVVLHSCVMVFDFEWCALIPDWWDLNRDCCGLMCACLTLIAEWWDFIVSCEVCSLSAGVRFLSRRVSFLCKLDFRMVEFHF